MRKGSVGDRWEARRLMGDFQVTHSLRGKHHTAKSKRHTGDNAEKMTGARRNGITLKRGLGQDKRKGGFWINISLLAWMKEEEEKLDKNIISSRWNGCL